MVTDDEKIPYLALDEHFVSAGETAVFPQDGHWNAKGMKLQLP
jgi:hypothetical protein